MEAILKFNLPEELDEFDRHLKGAEDVIKYHVALHTLHEAFRQKRKYAESETTWREAEELFWKTLNECGVSLE